MSHHPDYVRLAHEHGMLVALARYVEEEYLPTDLSDAPKTVVACDQLARGQSQIPKESWAAMLAKLERMAKSRVVEMSRFVQIQSGNTRNEEEDSIIPADAKDGARSQQTSQSGKNPQRVDRGKQPQPVGHAKGLSGPGGQGRGSQAGH